MIDKTRHSREDARNANSKYQPTAEQNDFVEKIVRAGEYQNVSEAIRDALRALQQRRREAALKLKALRLQLKLGIAALNRGDSFEVESAELDNHLE